MTVPMLAMALSAIAGASLGLVGGGGSILTVPILLYAGNLDTKEAISLSLLVVGITSAAAAVPHTRAGNVKWKAAGSFGVASMLGAALGGRLSNYVPSPVLLAAFTLMMLVTGVAMLRKRRAKATRPPTHALGRLGLYGMGVGLITGLVGAGGGFVIVPALVLFAGLDIMSAIGTSLVIIAMNSLTGFIAHLGTTRIDPLSAGLLVVSSAAGSLVGAMLTRTIKPESLRVGFAILVLAVAGVMAARQILPAFALLETSIWEGAIATR